MWFGIVLAVLALMLLVTVIVYACLVREAQCEENDPRPGDPSK